MKEQTIYSYKLLYRFRWRLSGYLSQVVLLLGSLNALAAWLTIPPAKLLVSLSIVALVPVIHFLLFRLYAYVRSQSPSVSPEMLFSAWWGAGTSVPISLSLFRGAELTVGAGSLLFSAALFVWLPFSYAMTLLIGSIVLALPRFLVLL
ncbi:hypothetical protein MXD63_39570, partial [Frankia sp. Cpl3]|nr:hypothetical protein [Frankia sp. Cpl3]